MVSDSQLVDLLDEYGISPDLSVVDHLHNLASDPSQVSSTPRLYISQDILVEHIVSDLNLEIFLEHTGSDCKPLDFSVLCPVKEVSDSKAPGQPRLERGAIQVRDGVVCASINDFNFFSDFVAGNPTPRGGILSPFPARALYIRMCIYVTS